MALREATALPCSERGPVEGFWGSMRRGSHEGGGVEGACWPKLLIGLQSDL
jgi:hypothetical protein